MQHASIFDFAFLAIFIATVLIRSPHHYKNEVAEKKGANINVLERLNFILLFTGSTTLPMLYLFSPWFNFADYPVNVYLGYLGCALGVFGLWLFWRSHVDLGRQFSPMLEIKNDHKLITHGVYNKIRHPMYSAVFILAFSQLLLIGNWVVGPFFLASFAVLYFCRVGNEEKMMLKTFGDEYIEYVKRTGRLFPVR